MSNISPEARAYVSANFTPGVAEFLLSGDGFRADLSPGPRDGIGRAWKDILDELAGQGYMRVTNSRRYRWGTRPGPQHRPVIGEPVNIRLGADLLPRVDRYAAEAGISRAEAIRVLVMQGLVTQGH
jgi:hypothetical protein